MSSKSEEEVVDAAAGELLRERAAQGWLSNREIVTALRNYDKLGLACQPAPPVLPASGTLHCFDRRRVRAFRRDGLAWQKKAGSKTVREAHEKLKVGTETLLNAYYCSREDLPRFQRRCYWLLEGDEGIVLVHYLDSGAGGSGCAGGGVAEPFVRPPRRAAAAAAAAAFAAARDAGRNGSGDDSGASGDDDEGDELGAVDSDADATDASAGAAPPPPPRTAARQLQQQQPQQQRGGGATRPGGGPLAAAVATAACVDPWEGLTLPWLDADAEAALGVPPPAAPRGVKRPAQEPRAWPDTQQQQQPQHPPQPQLQAKLLDYAPRGDTLAGGTRMLMVLAGGVVSGPIVALFDRAAVPAQWVAPGVLACVTPAQAGAATVALVLATPHQAPPGAPLPLLFAPLCAPVPFMYRDGDRGAAAALLSPYAQPQGTPLHTAAHAA